LRDLAAFYAALADEARLGILKLLLRSEELCVCEIVSASGFSQSKASRHLGILLGAGLVKYRRQGLWAYYSIAGDGDPLAGEVLRTLEKQFREGGESPPVPERQPAPCCRIRRAARRNPKGNP
jgi:ArsR family transcriptional regulator